jgi:hypothetical protein
LDGKVNVEQHISEDVVFNIHVWLFNTQCDDPLGSPHDQQLQPQVLSYWAHLPAFFHNIMVLNYGPQPQLQPQ